MIRKNLLFTAFLLLALALMILPAAAMGETDAGNYQPGEIVEADFIVSANPHNAVAATMKLVYDHSIFELIPSSVAAGDTVVLMDMSGLRTGTSFKISFRIHPSTAKGVYRIRMDLQQAGDINEKPVTDLTIEPVSVSVGQAATRNIASTPTFRPTPTPTRKPTASPTKKPTASPTKKPTATPGRDYQISTSVTMRDGKTTVTWTDSENAGPYQVAYEYVGGTATQSSFWAGGNETESTVKAKKFVFDSLAPGYTYRIKVWDANNRYTSAVITVPTNGSFRDSALNSSNINVEITPKYKNEKGTVFNAKELEASTIEKYLDKGTRFYGIRYEFTVPKGSRKVSYFTQLVFHAPNGYTHTEVNVQEDYDSTSGAQNRYWQCVGSFFFECLYEKNGSIPTGTYTVELFWDGMLVDKSTFSVK